MPAQLFSRIRRLGVLTGGGDVPGINAAIKALVYRAHDDDIGVLGLRGRLMGGLLLRLRRGSLSPSVVKGAASLSRPELLNGPLLDEWHSAYFSAGNLERCSGPAGDLFSMSPHGSVALA